LHSRRTFTIISLRCDEDIFSKRNSSRVFAQPHSNLENLSSLKSHNQFTERSIDSRSTLCECGYWTNVLRAPIKSYVPRPQHRVAVFSYFGVLIRRLAKEC
jgi:hypothetical protein